MARVLYVITIVAAVSIFALATRHVGAQADECVSNGAVPSGNDGLAQDCETLLDLKDTLRGSIALNWSSTLPITGWDGIRLGGSPKRVTIFKLQKRGLDGSIPAELGRLGACPRIRSWRRNPPRNNLLTAIWTLSWSK